MCSSWLKALINLNCEGTCDYRSTRLFFIPSQTNTIGYYQPDVLILDLRMPHKDGRTVLHAMQQAQCPTRVVLLTAAIEESEVLEAMHLGVHGVVLKEMASYLLVECVRKVHAGGQWIERRSVSQALNTLLRHRDGQRDVASILTRREQEIMRLVAQGIGNQSIAEALCISEGTVKIHLHNIYKKLHIDSRMALSLYANGIKIVPTHCIRDS